MGWGSPSRRGGTRAGCGSATGSTGRSWRPIWTARPEVMATRDPASHPMGYSIDWLPDGRLLSTGDKVRRQEPDGSMAVARRAASERDRGGRARQRLRQRRGLRLRRRCATQAGLHQAGHAGRAGAPGRRRHPVPQRHGHHPGRPDADHLRVVRRAAHRVRHRRRRRAVGAAGVRRRVSGRTASAWTPRERSGSRRAGSRSSGWPRAAPCCSGSSWRRAGRRSP